MQQKSKVVIDTNVIMSSIIGVESYPAKIFELFLKGSIKNYTTYEIIDEIKQVFDKPFFMKNIQPETREFVLKLFCEKSIIIESIFFDNICIDKEDNKFINCALSADAKIVISGDSHLLKIDEYKGIKFLCPRDYIELFFVK